MSIRFIKLLLIGFCAFALTLCVFGLIVGFVMWNLDPAAWGGGGRMLLIIFGVPTAVYIGLATGAVFDGVLE